MEVIVSLREVNLFHSNKIKAVNYILESKTEYMALTRAICDVFRIYHYKKQQ